MNVIIYTPSKYNQQRKKSDILRLGLNLAFGYQTQMGMKFITPLTDDCTDWLQT